MRKIIEMNKLDKILIAIGTFGVFITLIPIITYIFFFGIEISNKHQVWAESGDFFGGIINPILAFLSFIALLVTINIQIKDHKASIQELEETKRIHAEQSIIFSNQNFELIKDKYDKRFFQLIEIQSRSEEKLFYKGYLGTSAFPIIEKDIVKILQTYWISSNEELIRKIQIYFDENFDFFDPFFRSLMFKIDFVLDLKQNKFFENKGIRST